MAAIEFRNLEKIFPDGSRAIRNFSLRVKDGELLVLLGPSGCGKSTLLRVVAGLDDVTAGQIALDGRVVNHLTPRQRNVAMVFQNYALYPHMTVRANIEFPLRMLKMPKKQMQRRVEDVAQTLGLTEFLERKPKALSGGQAQRVAMARAMVREPAVFLMDEPLSNLDAKLRVQIRNDIAALQKRVGRTMLYVTHDQVEAMTLGERVALLRAGELQQVGEPQDLYDHPANVFVAGFIGSPAMNIFQVGVLREGHRVALELAGQRIPLPPGSTAGRVLATADAKTFLVGLRPEGLQWPDNRPDLPSLDLNVAMVESLGHEQIVYFRAPGALVDLDRSTMAGSRTAGEGLMAARLPMGRSALAGERLRLALDPAKLHWFDKNGKCL